MRLRKPLFPAALTLAAALAPTTPVLAGPVDPKYIPPDAKWVVHIDVDTVAKSRLWNFLQVNIDALGEKKHLAVGFNAASTQAATERSKKLAAVGDMLGMRLPEDVHGITLVGRTFDETGAVLLVNAKVDRDRVIGMAKINPGYTSTTYSGLELSGWKAGEEGVVGTFLADDVIVVGRTDADVKRAIDAARNPAPTTTGPSLNLLGGSTSSDAAGIMVYIAADGLAELQQKAELSPVLAPVTSARASVGERGDDLVVKAALSLKTPEAARQVRGALEGLRALLALATMDANADKDAMRVMEVTQRATSSVEGSTLTVEVPVALSLVGKLCEEVAGGAPKPPKPPVSRQAVAAQPATAPAHE